MSTSSGAFWLALAVTLVFSIPALADPPVGAAALDNRSQAGSPPPDTPLSTKPAPAAPPITAAAEAPPPPLSSGKKLRNDPEPAAPIEYGHAVEACKNPADLMIRVNPDGDQGLGILETIRVSRKPDLVSIVPGVSAKTQWELLRPVYAKSAHTPSEASFQAVVLRKSSGALVSVACARAIAAYAAKAQAETAAATPKTPPAPRLEAAVTPTNARAVAQDPVVPDAGAPMMDAGAKRADGGGT